MAFSGCWVMLFFWGGGECRFFEEQHEFGEGWPMLSFLQTDLKIDNLWLLEF